MTGGGGNVGAVLTQVIFFRGSRFKTETGITLMGVMILCCSLSTVLIRFPQWGGMFCGPSSIEATEEDYYMSEWSSGEKEKGLHQASLKFADNSRRERGRRVECTTSSPDETISARVWLFEYKPLSIRIDHRTEKYQYRLLLRIFVTRRIFLCTVHPSQSSDETLCIHVWLFHISLSLIS